ncbi:MAG: hypothetical protein CL607_23095 [Anaerolineaceae bacterium]|nr:hypothetical protein [Anaerolineaceae bacterium]
MQKRLSVIGLALVLTLVVWTVAAQDEPDIDSLVVVNTIETDLRGGPGATAGYLSPDGSLLAHNDGSSFCFYTLPDLAETSCTPFLENRRPQADSVIWSPDSRYLVFMDNDLLRMFRDSDIWIIDSADGSMTNLTEDDTFDVALMREPEGPVGLMDLSPQWVDDTTIAFIRYTYLEDEETYSTAELFTVSVDGGDATLLYSIPQSNGRLDMYYMGWRPYSNQYVVNIWQRNDEVDAYGLLMSQDGDTPVSVLASTDPTSRAANIQTITIAPNGESVLHYDGQMLGMGRPPTSPEDSVAMVTQFEDRATVLIDPERPAWEAGWAPDGQGMVYTVRSPQDEQSEGLYLTSAVGEPGHMILEGRFGGTTPYRQQPIQWASNNTILVTDGESQLVVVELGTE